MANLVASPDALDVNGTSPWAYSAVGVTVAANALNAPDGTLTAETITVVNASASYHRQPVTVTASTQYTYSFYCKRGTSTSLNISLYDISNAADILPTESYYAETNSSTWSRVERTFTTPVGCVSVYVYTHRDNPTTGTYHAWRAYLNTGASPEEALITEGPAPRIVVPTVAVSMR